MMNTMEDKSLCGLIKFHSARLAEVAKDTEELQASIDNEVVEAYQKGFEDGKAVNDKGCEGCMYQDNTIEHHPCGVCRNAYNNRWTAKADKIEVGDEVETKDGKRFVVTTFGSSLNGDIAVGVCTDGFGLGVNLKELRKTGRHFNIEKILEAMKA